MIEHKRLRVVIVTQDDPFYICEFFKTFLEKAVALKIDIQLIAILRPFNESFLSLIKRVFLFYGLVDFTRLGVRYVVLRMFDKIGISTYSLRNLASYYDIQFKEIRDVNDTNFISYIKFLSPDVILSVTAPQIFKKELLSVPTWGCINVHSSRLPKYRGMMPNFWAMYHGDSMAGITVHTMDTQIDKGKIIVQKEIPIYHSDSLDSLIKRSKREGAKLVIQALEMIRDGRVKLKDYRGEESYFSFPERRHVKEFRKRGYRLL